MTLQNALAQGMQSGSPMNAQTPSAPGFDPGTQPPAQPPMPNQSPMSQIRPMPGQVAGGQPQGQGQMMTLPVNDSDPNTPGVQIPASESELLIKALNDRLKSLSKIHTMAAQAAYPQPQQEAQAQ